MCGFSPAHRRVPIAQYTATHGSITHTAAALPHCRRRLSAKFPPLPPWRASRTGAAACRGRPARRRPAPAAPARRASIRSPPAGRLARPARAPGPCPGARAGPVRRRPSSAAARAMAANQAGRGKGRGDCGASGSNCARRMGPHEHGVYSRAASAWNSIAAVMRDKQKYSSGRVDLYLVDEMADLHAGAIKGTAHNDAG
jgi:hypothetical protein